MLDANNSKFRHLLGPSDWPELHSDSPSTPLVWDAQDASVHLKEELFVFTAPGGVSSLSLRQRRAAARDRYGACYWISPNKAVIMRSEGKGDSRPWWKPAEQGVCDVKKGDFQPKEMPIKEDWLLQGLCITDDHYLVVGVVEPTPHLLILDLHAGGVPLVLAWPEDSGFLPLDIAAGPDGGFWVLDQGGANSAGRLWCVNRSFQVCPAAGAKPSDAIALSQAQMSDFGVRDADGILQLNTQAAHYFPAAIELAKGKNQIYKPIAIAVLEDNAVLLLDYGSAHSKHSQLHLFSGDGTQQTAPLDQEAVGVRMDDAEGLRAHYLQHVAEPEGLGVISVIGPYGNQVFSFRQDPASSTFKLKLTADYYPLFGFDGRALIEHQGKLWYDHDTRWLPVVEQKRPRFETQGQLESRILDSEIHDCVWHRIIMDLDIPPSAVVQIETRCADRITDLDEQEWRPEPLPTLRAVGAELPWHRPFGETPCDGAGSWDLLLQAARGRYLAVRLTFSGNQRVTPRLRSMRVWFPRFSYLNEYLPAVYRQDADSASFLDRYLSNVEGLLTTWEDRIAMSQLLMDARTAPSEYLPWLASWLGVVFDPLWDESRRRLFLRHASGLFRQRGTVSGMVRLIRLSIDACPDDRLFSQDVINGVQPVRVAEAFLQRPAARIDLSLEQVVSPGVVLEEAVEPLKDWRPERGAQPLHQAWQQWLQDQNTTTPTSLFPAIEPQDSALQDIWRVFLEERLHFTYAPVAATDLCAWQTFLLHRYRRLEGIAEAYGQRFEDVSQVSLPDHLPSGGVQLSDWIRFVSVYLPARQNAHRFSVLVPEPRDVNEGQLRLYFQRIEQIVELAKPAHTQFDVQVYSGLCRVGVARLGIDTVLEQSARSSGLSLGAAVLGNTYLDTVYPYNLSDRRVLAPGRTCPTNAI